ncbi:MAG: FIST N-terminal domain-containing protein, partial [Gemmobacter sp.]
AREDALAAALAGGLGPVPLFGGSAGDGTRFRQTRVLAGGAARGNAAVVALVRTACPVRVFNLDHLVPTETRMVVTRADPARRIVQAINAEPAAREYARLAGKDPAQLTPFTFAAHPVVVRIGGQHHVRAIREVAGDDLIFYSAIGEGLVLTLARPQDMAAHLARALGALDGPAAILACDCILRRMEAEENQQTQAISALLRRHRVTGFSTYGEQRNAMHVNQTLTGVALYPPP